MTSVEVRSYEHKCICHINPEHCRHGRSQIFPKHKCICLIDPDRCIAQFNNHVCICSIDRDSCQVLIHTPTRGTV